MVVLLLAVLGSNWSSAISTAKWKGARLRDILLAAGVNEEVILGDGPDAGKIKHVHFLGADNMQVISEKIMLKILLECWLQL